MSENSSLDPTTMPNCTGEIGEPAARCNQEFTQQIKLTPIDGETVSLNGIPWSVHFEKEEHNTHGKTDTEGKTERIKTSQPQKFFALVGKLAEGYRRRGNNFGTLKEVNERKISLVTAPKYPEREVPYCSGYDYITVISARTAPWSMNLKNFFRDSPGNQYRFINCGLRQLREFPLPTTGDDSIQRIMVVFKQGYNQYDILKINEYAEKQSSRVIYVKNNSEFVSFLNQRKEKRRLIKKMVFFCHGIIDYATFHYQGDDVDEGLFGTAEIKRVYESIFDYDATVVTYACRAGISVDGDDLSGKDAGQEQSPAQKMADTWDVKVNAFEMRSSYVGVYGTAKEIELANDYDKTIRVYKEELSKYEESLAQGNKNAEPPQKPDDYDENVRRNIDIKERNANEDNNGGPIAPNGSWRFPTTGNTPIGLQKGLQIYIPLEWRES
ncbi:hypothetical protein [Klebsiella sp. DNRA6]|uniref:hypothetical protein n=1 Tax=Klebsiella sp. DNRA6 TaxID=2723057 RepID=UPI002006EAF2|nr:hypothetical protein [Klebsiella sp. DNRA6]